MAALAATEATIGTGIVAMPVRLGARPVFGNQLSMGCPDPLLGGVASAPRVEGGEISNGCANI